MLDPSASPKEVAENFDAHFDYSKQYGDMAKDVHVELVPLTDIYYMNEDSSGSLVKSGSAEKTRLLTLIAFLVIIVAGINFTNFSTSLAPLRIKSINTIETTNRKPINAVRNFFPEEESPKEPFKTTAGGKDVIYKDG